MNAEREKRIDFFKGIAIVLVMIGHGIMLLQQNGYISNEISGGGNAILRIVTSFHMPLFFVVSGYLSFGKNYATTPVFDIVKKNMIVLYLPYLFMEYGYWLERILAQKCFDVTLIRDSGNSIGQFVRLLYKNENGGAGWFLLSMCCIKIIFELGAKYEKIVYITVLFAVVYWLFNLNILPYAFARYISWGIFFMAGYYMGKYKTVILNEPFVRIWAFMGVMVGLQLLIDMKEVNHIVKYIVGVSVSLLLFSFQCKRAVCLKPIQWLGRNTLLIFILHRWLQYINFLVWKNVIGNAAALLATMVLCQIAECYCVYLLYKKVRFLKWIEFIFYPGKFLIQK